MKHVISLKTIICLISIGLLISSCTCVSYNGRSFNHHAEKKVHTSSPVTAGELLYTNLTHMDLNVVGQDTDECVIDADLTVSATSQEIADAVIEQLDIQFVQEAGRAVIALESPQEYTDDYFISGHMTMTLPSKVRLEMITTHGDCRIENVAGDINIKSTHGDFVFDKIGGDLTAASTHGNIELTQTQTAKTNLKTTHGRIALNDCGIDGVSCSTTHDPIRLKKVLAESLDLHTTHGPIELTDCTAKDAVLNTTHGAITGDVAGVERITAQTSHAPIRMRCFNEINADLVAALKTTHNNIKFSPPEGFTGNVHISTSHGKIRSDLPIIVQGVISDNQFNGIIGQGSGSITLTSTHGDIKLEDISKTE